MCYNVSVEGVGRFSFANIELFPIQIAPPSTSMAKIGSGFIFSGENMNAKQIELFWNLVSIGEPDECWAWNGKKTRDGYGGLKRNGKALSAHRVSYEISTGDSAAGFCIMHACDNKVCVNPKHLKRGTHKENMEDMVAKRRQGIQPKEKKFLSVSQVLDIRRNYLLGESKHSLARRHNTSTHVISGIVSRKYRKDVLL